MTKTRQKAEETVMDWQMSHEDYEDKLAYESYCAATNAVFVDIRENIPDDIIRDLEDMIRNEIDDEIVLGVRRPAEYSR